MPRYRRLALALLASFAAPLAHASAHASVCPADPGHAPTGDLTATRVSAARVDDSEDRLYEGPVWRDGALYLSDFVHSGTFPSRVRRFTPPDRWETVVEDSGSNGLTLDLEWRDGRPTSLRITATRPQTTIVRWGESSQELTMTDSGQASLSF